MNASGNVDASIIPSWNKSKKGASRLLELEQEWKLRIQTLQTALRQQREETTTTTCSSSSSTNSTASSLPITATAATLCIPTNPVVSMEEEEETPFSESNNDGETNHHQALLSVTTATSSSPRAATIANDHWVTPTAAHLVPRVAPNSSTSVIVASTCQPLVEATDQVTRTEGATPAAVPSSSSSSSNNHNVSDNTTSPPTNTDATDPCSSSSSSLLLWQQQEHDYDEKNRQARRLLDLEQTWIQASQELQQKEEEMRNVQCQVMQLRETLTRIEWDMQLFLHQEEGEGTNNNHFDQDATSPLPEQGSAITVLTNASSSLPLQQQQQHPPTRLLQHRQQQQTTAPVVWWSGLDRADGDDNDDDEEEEEEEFCLPSTNSSVSSIWRQPTLSRTVSTATSTGSSSVSSLEDGTAAAAAAAAATGPTASTNENKEKKKRASKSDSNSSNHIKEVRRNPQLPPVPPPKKTQQQPQPLPQHTQASAATTTNSTSPTLITPPASPQPLLPKQQQPSNLVTVSQRHCKDAHGKRGVYDGTISPSTRLPHGQGKMVYQMVEDDGKLTTTTTFYQGEWNHGHYQGQGTFHQETTTWSGGGSSYIRSSSSTACSVDGDDDDDDITSQQCQDAKEVLHYDGQWHMHAKHGPGRLEYHPPSLSAQVGWSPKMTALSSSSQPSPPLLPEYSPARILDGWWDDDVMMQGTLKLPQVGSCYQGTFDSQQRRHGMGLMMYADGSCYHGAFSQGQMQGQG